MATGQTRWPVCLFLWVMHASATAGLLDDFDRAQRYDPTYAALLAEGDIGKLQARIAGMAYYPEARLSASQLDNESTSRTTISISQPIINYDRWLTLKESEPRLAQVASKLEAGQQDLASRLFKTVASLVEARNKVTLNNSAVLALEQQRNSAKQAFEFGLGTVTDLRDTEVRLAQSRAMSFALQASLEAAERAYRLLVGVAPSKVSYELSSGSKLPKLAPLTSLIEQALRQNPSVRMSKIGAQLAEIGIERARASFYPSLAASFQRSQAAGSAAVSGSQVAIRMDVPIQAATFFRGATADLELKRAQEIERDARMRVSAEVERLHAVVQASMAELAVRGEAVKASELSYEANEKSFKGGFRTKLDVLNALQASFQAKADFASALLRLGESSVLLRLTAADPVDSVLQEAQDILFQGR